MEKESIAPELLELLRCPETGQRLATAPAGMAAALESRRASGALRLAASEPQFDHSRPIEGALLREDGQVCYLIQDGIALLLPGHGVKVKM